MLPRHVVPMAKMSLQGMHKWTGGPSDEWAFLKIGYRDPISKAKLASYLAKGILRPTSPICHMSAARQLPEGKDLGQCVQEWKAESLKHLGENTCLCSLCSTPQSFIEHALAHTVGGAHSMSPMQSISTILPCTA